MKKKRSEDADEALSSGWMLKESVWSQKCSLFGFILLKKNPFPITVKNLTENFDGITHLLKNVKVLSFFTLEVISFYQITIFKFS